MSVFQADAPFGLGETYAGTRNGSLINGDLEGQEFDFPVTEDIATALGMRGRTSGRQIRARIVRNVAGVALLGKRLGTVTKDSVANSTKVTGYSGTSAEKYIFPIDPFLPAAGVADDDLFFVILRGPATLITPSDALLIASAIAAGDTVMGSADANGRVIKATEDDSKIGSALGVVALDVLDTELIVDVALPWA